MEKKRIQRRYRNVSWVKHLVIVIIKCIVVILTFCFWTLTFTTVTTIVSDVESTSPTKIIFPDASLQELHSERVWIPYELARNEISTGQLSQESAYSGIYKYEIATNKINRNCRIHFPVEMSMEQENDVDDHGALSSMTCLVSHIGSKGYDVPNQDRSVVMEGYDSSTNLENRWSLAALFDGHGDFGHVTSHVAVTELPSLIVQSIFRQSTRKLKSLPSITTTDIPNIMKQSFQNIDSTGVISKVPRGGSTAIIAFQWGSWVHIASVGDSTAVVVQWLNTATQKSERQQSNNGPRYKILGSAVKHKPGDPVERNRIEANGGSVYIPLNPKETSRVLYNVQDIDGRTVQTALAMSRSLGDTSAKEQNLVIADPDVVSIDLSGFRSTDNVSSAVNQIASTDRFFVILASDGVTDMVLLDDVIERVGHTMYNHLPLDKTDKNLMLITTCRSVVSDAIQAWRRATNNNYRDDISLVVQEIIL
jgi:serine/threonine protein phosphatase PrpC